MLTLFYCYALPLKLSGARHRLVWGTGRGQDWGCTSSSLKLWSVLNTASLAPILIHFSARHCFTLPGKQNFCSTESDPPSASRHQHTSSLFLEMMTLSTEVLSPQQVATEQLVHCLTVQFRDKIREPELL